MRSRLTRRSSPVHALQAEVAELRERLAALEIGLAAANAALQAQPAEIANLAEYLLERARLEADAAVAALAPREEGSERIDDELYLALENRFRGDSADVTERLRVYLPFVEHLAGGDLPLVDLGCGRGEWLDLLRDQAVPVRGVDSNEAMVQASRARGHDVEHADLLGYLRREAPSSKAGLSLFHVVEHFPFAVIATILDEAARVLAPGGVLLLETPNGYNVAVGATTFWVDPTHQRIVYPDVLQFLTERAGFTAIQPLNLHPTQPPLGAGDDEASRSLARVHHSLYGPADFGLVARRPG